MFHVERFCIIYACTSLFHVKQDAAIVFTG